MNPNYDGVVITKGLKIKVVQTYKSPNPNVNKVNFKILSP
jgi:hypothetical protein